MAENNSSAPLKTAEGAYPALPKPDYPAQFDGHGGEQSSDESYSAEQMRAYAAQAVAAQAPADPMSWPLPCDVKVGHGTMRKGVKLSTLVLRMKALYKMATGEDADEVAARSPEVRARMLAAFQAQIGAKPVVCDSVHITDSGKTATPVLFATEDSSAGDLAAPTDAEIIALNDGERFFSMSESRFGKEVNPHTQYHTGGPGYLQFARAVLARWGSAPQAQPADALDAAADLWYLQDTRSYVGNDVVWWAKDGNGYTTDVSKAHAYTRDYAFRQAAMRGCDRAWPKAYIDGKARPAVDMQYIDHQAAMAAAQEGGNAAKEA